MPVSETAQLHNPWVKLKKYCEDYGDTPSAVHQRRAAGKWKDGVHCLVRDRKLWINLQEVRKWVEHKSTGTGSRTKRASR